MQKNKLFTRGEQVDIKANIQDESNQVPFVFWQY